jgi:hypothetical protein
MRVAQFALVSLVALASSATVARAQSAKDLAGLWRRLPTKDSKEKFYRFSANGDGTLEGVLLNPPEGLECQISLNVDGNKLFGVGAWIEGEHRAEAKWELLRDRQGNFGGRLEWLDWEEGTIFERGWEEHRFERVARVGLVTTGAGDAEEAFGEPVDLTTLAGGWAGPGGPWAIEQDKISGKKLRLVPVGHHDGNAIDLTDERGTLKGRVAGLSTEVELAFSDGKLEGRTQWIEGQDLGELAQRGWAAVSFTRLPRIDGGAKSAVDGPTPGETSKLLDGVWKREDGLFLRLRPEGAVVVGVLSGPDGAVRGRVELAAVYGRWVGTANWDGVEAKWELAAAEGGGLTGRCEWLDVHSGLVVARGWSAHAFKPLRRVH